MGDIPAPAISTEAVYKTENMFETEIPKDANLLKRSRSTVHYIIHFVISVTSVLPSCILATF